jgi:hypothetical protein
MSADTPRLMVFGQVGDTLFLMDRFNIMHFETPAYESCGANGDVEVADENELARCVEQWYLTDPTVQTFFKAELEAMLKLFALTEPPTHY